MIPPISWPLAAGGVISCRDKLRVLEENQTELATMMQDAFEDAVLMGVDETAMRQILTNMVDRLRSPLKARA
jgi:hypothetical protein